MTTKTRMKRLFCALCAVLACAVLMGCDTPPAAPGGPVAPSPQVQFAKALLDAAVRVYGTEELQRRAPQLVPLLDRDPDGDGPLVADGIIELAEIAAYPWQDPAGIAVILVVAERLIRERR